MNTTDIIICTHKQDFPKVVSNPSYVVINSKDIDNDTWNGLKGSFLSEILIYFNVAEYWQLKDYIGFCHYRRYWDFLDNLPNFKQLIGENGIVVAQPLKFTTSVKQHYTYYHNIEDLEIVTKIIIDKFKEYSQTWSNFLDGNIFIPYNMFIMTSKEFKEYVKFIKTIILEYLNIVGKNIDQRIEDNKEKYLKDFEPNNQKWYQYRIGGYLAERLTNLWIFQHHDEILISKVLLTEKKYFSEKN